MYGNDLLRSVLPIDSAPDFRAQRGRVAPEYDDKKSKAENLKEYKLYSMLCCELYVEDEINDSLGPDALIDLVILKAMYHPRFPSTFFNLIANSVDGIPILQTKDVIPYLEGNYAEGLQQPDCEYLSLILALWSKRYPVLYPANLKKAQAWLDKKQQSLPTWPHAPNASLQLSELQSDIGLLPSEVAILKRAFKELDLLDDNDCFRPQVKPGAVAGVIRYLIRQKNFNDDCTSIFSSLQSEFAFKSSLSTIQHYMDKSKQNVLFFNRALEHLGK